MSLARTTLLAALLLPACTRSDALALGEAEAELAPAGAMTEVVPWAAPAPTPPIHPPAPEPELTHDPLVLKLRDADPDKSFLGCDFDLDVEGLPAARDDGLVAYVIDYQPPLSSMRVTGVVFEPAAVPEEVAFRTDPYGSDVELFMGSELPQASDQSHEDACASYRAAREAELAELAATMGDAKRWRAMQRLPAQHWNATVEFAERERADLRSPPPEQRPVQVVVSAERLIARVLGVNVFFDVELPRDDTTIVTEMWFEPHSRAGLIVFEELDRESCDCSCNWDVSAYALVWPQNLLDWALAHPCNAGHGYDDPLACHKSQRW